MITLSHCNINKNNKTTKLVFVNIKINGKFVKALVDCGAERSCCKNNPHLLEKSKIFPSNRIILGADGTKFSAGKQTDFNIDFSPEFSRFIKHIQIVDNLAYDFIMGMDVLGDALKYDSDFVYIKGHKIPRNKQEQVLRVNKEFELIHHVNQISLKNPFYHDKSAKYLMISSIYDINNTVKRKKRKKFKKKYKSKICY